MMIGLPEPAGCVETCMWSRLGMPLRIEQITEGE